MTNIIKERANALKEEGLRIMNETKPDRGQLRKYIESVLNELKSINACPNPDLFFNTAVIELMLGDFEYGIEIDKYQKPEDRHNLLCWWLGLAVSAHTELYGEVIELEYTPEFCKHSYLCFIGGLRDLGLINIDSFLAFLEQSIRKSSTVHSS